VSRALVAVMVALLGAAPAHPAGEHVPIGYVKVLRVSQRPYSAVEFRMAIKAPVGLLVSVGYKIFDERGDAVYRGVARREALLDLVATSFTLTWRKRGYDGLAVPRGRSYFVAPFAGDLEDRDQDDRPGQLVRGRSVAFVLR
jgi:hypothetical protein